MSSEDDAGVLVVLVGVAPDVVVAVGRVGVAARLLEPRVLVGGVVDHQVGDDAHAAAVGRVEEALEVRQRAVVGVDRAVVGDVVAVVAQGRGVERQEPEAVDAQVLEVVELLGEPGEVADAVAVAVVERADVQLVEDGVLVPERIVLVISLDRGSAVVVEVVLAAPAALDPTDRAAGCSAGRARLWAGPLPEAALVRRSARAPRRSRPAPMPSSPSGSVQQRLVRRRTGPGSPPPGATSSRSGVRLAVEEHVRRCPPGRSGGSA